MKVKVKKYTGVYGGYKLKKAEYEEPNFYRTLENPSIFKAFEQKYGFNPAEVWNLDETIARFILPRLTYYKDIHTGYPQQCSYEQFEEYLDKMIYSFLYIAQGKHYNLSLDINERKQQLQKVQEGLDLFSKYFMNLWD